MRLGFIGAGNMGGAVLGGVILSEIVEKKDVFVVNRRKESTKDLIEKYEITGCESIKEVVESSDIIIIGVKPNVIEDVLLEMKELVLDKIVVSMSVSTTLEKMESILGDKKIARVMPNLAALVSEGVTAISYNENFNEEDKEEINKIFSSVGLAIEVSENSMDAVSAVSGSSPAFYAMFIEAIVDGAVLNGLPRDVARELAVQTMLGSAKLLQKSYTNASNLKEAVCSPGGTTIEGVRVLENKNFRAAIIESQAACVEKARKMRR